MLSNEMYESFYNDLEDKPFEFETSDQTLDKETEDEAVKGIEPPTIKRSSPTAASLFFCLPVERAETATTEIPTLPRIFVGVEGGILRHDVR